MLSYPKGIWNQSFAFIHVAFHPHTKTGSQCIALVRKITEDISLCYFVVYGVLSHHTVRFSNWAQNDCTIYRKYQFCLKYTIMLHFEVLSTYTFGFQIEQKMAD